MDAAEEIQEIVKSSEFLTTKALRIAAILERTGINGGWVDFPYLKLRFPDVPHNTLSNLLPHLKRQGLLKWEDSRLTDNGREWLSGKIKTPQSRVAARPVTEQYTHPPVPWDSLYSLDVPGKEIVLRYMEQALEGLSGNDREFVTTYLIRTLCNSQTFDSTANAYRPRNSDFRRGSIISDIVKKYRDERGIPPELYAALQLLPPDDRTADVLGTYLLGRVPREDGLRALARMSLQKDAESAYRAAKLPDEMRAF